MSTYITSGIILKKTDLGEADRLFSIYTATQGKILAQGRSCKRITSKLNPSLQDFACLKLMIAPGKVYDHVAGVEIIQNFKHLKSDFKKIILGAFALEAVEKLTRLDHGEERVFELLRSYLKNLDENDYSNGEWRTQVDDFTVELLDLFGFAPEDHIKSHTEKLKNFLYQHTEKSLNTDKFLEKMLT